MAQITKTAVKLDKRDALFILSFSFFFAWVDNSFFISSSPLPFDRHQLAFSISTAHSLVVAVSTLPGLLWLWARTRPFAMRVLKRSPRNVAIAALGASLGTVLMNAYSAFNTQAFFVAAIVLSGLSMGVIVLWLGLIVCHEGLAKASITIPLGVACVTLVNIAVKGLLPLVALAFICLLVPISGFCLVRYDRASKAKTSSEEDKAGKLSLDEADAWHRSLFPWRLVLIIVTSVLMFEVMRFLFILPSSDAGRLTDLGLYVRGISATILFVGAYFFSWKLSRIFKLGLILLAGGFALTPLVDGLGVAYTIFIVGYTFFDVMIWSVMGALGGRFPDKAYQLSVGIWLLRKAGGLGGRLLGSALGVASFVDVNQVATILAYALLIVAVICLDSGSFNLWGILRIDGGAGARSSEEHIAALISEHNLTEREGEVLSYLAVGRSIPWIANELNIAEGTARVHARHIYEKLGLHSKQELINLTTQYKLPEEQ